MSKKGILHVAILVFSFVGCHTTKVQGEKSPNEILETKAPDSHTSENALDWDGIYVGILPCADCEGIKTTISLNKDLSYNIKDDYLGKEGGVFESKGTFKWSDNGQIIMLSDSDRNTYFVGENTLTQLDKSGNKITGDLANSYILKKMNQQEITFKNTKWKLVKIMGKEVNDSKAFISFTTENNRFFGNNSCNSFNGSYEVKNGSQITLSQVATTMMACLEETIEAQFMDVLNRADNYSFNGTTMTLNKARMAPLAVFEAID